MDILLNFNTIRKKKLSLVYTILHSMVITVLLGNFSNISLYFYCFTQCLFRQWIFS